MRIQISLLAILLAIALTQDPYCLQNDGFGGCTQCIPFFYLRNDTCTQVSSNCLTYDNFTGACQSCLPGSTLSGGNCVTGGNVSSSTTTTTYTIGSGSGSSGSSSNQTQLGLGASQITPITLPGFQLPPPPQFNITALPGSATTTTTTYSYSSNGSSNLQNASNLNIGNTGVGLPTTSGQVGSSTTTSNANLNTLGGFSSNNLVGSSGLTSTFGSSGLQSNITSASPLSTQPTIIQSTILPISLVSPTSFGTSGVNGSQRVTTTTTTTRSTGSTSGSTGNSAQGFISTAQPQPQLQTVSLPIFQSTSLQQPQQPQLQQTQQYPTFGLQGGFQQTTTISQQQQQQQQQQLQQQQLQQQQQQFRDPNCNQFASNSNQCIRCATRYYINNQSGLCTAIAGQCSSYDQNTGACQGCYPGFVFMNGQCYVQVSSGSTGDANCRISQGGICQSCYQGYFVRNGACVASNPLCASIDSNGFCLSCYSGYLLDRGNCIIANVAGAPANCANFSNGVCVRCAQGSYFSNGQCIAVSPLCQTYDNNTGNCLSCFNGYVLQGPTCILSSPTVNQGGNNCRNWTNGRCYECSRRFYMNNGQCLPVNDYCNDYDVYTGACTTCYQGFVLQQGACYRTIATTAPQIGQAYQSGSQNQVGDTIYQQTTTVTYLDTAAQAAQAAALAAQQRAQQSSGFLYSQGSNNTAATLSTSSVSSSSSSGGSSYLVPTNTQPCIQQSSQETCLQCNSAFRLINGQCILILE